MIKSAQLSIPKKESRRRSHSTPPRAQAVGAWFKRPETPTLTFLATSLTQFFLTGVRLAARSEAERAVGDHDRNTLRLRLDLQGDPTGFEPGMSVWLDP